MIIARAIEISRENISPKILIGGAVKSSNPRANSSKIRIVRKNGSPMMIIVRGGDQRKTGPGARATNDALRNAKKRHSTNILVDGFTIKAQTTKKT
jgi:hypothetical protein